MSLARLALSLGYGAGAPNGAGVRLDAELAALAVREQVAPLFGKRLLAGGLDGEAADGGAAELVRAYRECTARALLRERSAAPVLAAVSRRGIPVMWLKGAALVRMVYGDPGVRWMGDIDVLVPAERWREARQVAAAAGAESMAVPGRGVTADHDYVAAVRAPGGAVIELHRYFGPRPLFGVDYDAVIARGRDDGDGFLSPDPVDLFVSLALHAAKHGFILPFRAIIDGLALAAAHRVVDRVEARAAEWRGGRATAIWILVLMRFGLAADPWAGIAERLAGGAVGGSLAGAIARRAPYPPDGSAAQRGWPRIARIAAAVDRPERAAAYLLQRVALRAGDAVDHALAGFSHALGGAARGAARGQR